jgi:hypothetical protein
MFKHTNTADPSELTMPTVIRTKTFILEILRRTSSTNAHGQLKTIIQDIVASRQSGRATTASATIKEFVSRAEPIVGKAMMIDVIAFVRSTDVASGGGELSSKNQIEEKQRIYFLLGLKKLLRAIRFASKDYMTDDVFLLWVCNKSKRPNPGPCNFPNHVERLMEVDRLRKSLASSHVNVDLVDVLRRAHAVAGDKHMIQALRVLLLRKL